MLIGRTLGKYKVLEEIGKGGMAIVYKAFDAALQRVVAMKVLLPQLAMDRTLVQRFQREAITAANLRHPNIVTIHDVGTRDGYYYIVMEYLEGPSLQQELRRVGALPLPRVVNLVAQLASALDYAHQQGLVHRDVKPSNIMIGLGDRVTLTDFGLVKAAGSTRLTQDGTSVGTLAYMAPEQLRGEEVDYRSDVYSLGVVVYEMLTGKLPFQAATSYEAMRLVLSQKPVPPSRLRKGLSPQADRVLLRALAKKPEERFRSAGELAVALEQAIGVTAPSRKSAVARLPRRWVGLKLVGAGIDFPLYEGTIRIGRELDNDLVIPENQVSRHHAEVRCQSRTCRLVDLNSTNGTFVNGQKLPPHTPLVLCPGDRISMGPVTLEVVLSLTTPPSQPTDKRTVAMEY